MNKLIIIGNGFDLAHKLKTSYSDFIDWYFDDLFSKLKENEDSEYNDGLFHFSVNKRNKEFKKLKNFVLTKEFFTEGWCLLGSVRNNGNEMDIKISNLLEKILANNYINNWVDIENEYYKLLLSETNYNKDTIDSLNTDFKFIQDKLVEYLKIVEKTKWQPSEEIKEKIKQQILKREIRPDWNRGILNMRTDTRTLSEEIEVRDFMLLNFNYTNIAEKYISSEYINYIHGKLDKPENIIFGYGDELDENYVKLEKYHDNKCLDNIKSIRYSETTNYRRMLEFIESDVFQVCIMGHSCGNSDRTLLNTIFEHKNCVSIKPYYYIKEDGSDNYRELYQNISRNVKNKQELRAKIVCKEYCKTIK